MPRVPLEPGQNTIDTSTPVAMPGGGYQLQWRICLRDGRVAKYTTKCSRGTKGDVRRKAKKKAEELLVTNGKAGAWKPLSPMSSYVEDEAIKAMEERSDLRQRSKDAYARALRLFAKEARGHSIANATRPSVLEGIFIRIAQDHGSSSAKQAKKVVSKYVMERLVRDEIIASNTLRDFSPQLPENKVGEKPEGGQALSAEEREKVIRYLLGLDAANVDGPIRGRYTWEQIVAKRRLAIDVTLVQATTGMRISEVRALRRANVDESSAPLVFEVTENVSKTHRGRKIPLLDDRVEKRVRERLATLHDSPDAYVFPSPATVNSEWDSSNASKTLKKFYLELAEKLDIPLLEKVLTHVWRTTLNTEWMERGIPGVVRAAYFGHTEEVNKRYYTDLTDIAPLVKMLSKGGR